MLAHLKRLIMILSKTVILAPKPQIYPRISLHTSIFSSLDLNSLTFDAHEIHNVMLLLEKYFVENQLWRVKYNQSNHSIQQHLICLKESLGKKHRTSGRPTFQVSSGLVCKFLPTELIMNCGMLLSFEEATSLRPGQADTAPPIAKT